MNRPATGPTPPTAPVDAVTVILVRDRLPGDRGAADTAGPADTDAPTASAAGGTSDGLEVLLLERHGDSAFAPGALVFPGGKLDPADADLPGDRWRCTDLGAWPGRLGVVDEDAAVALLVAAVRETFEESGVLLARHADGTQLHRRPLPEVGTAAVRARMAARDGAEDWRSWLAGSDLVLDLDALAMWSWWVTPAGLPRRFDTRFLVAEMPPGQLASQDDVETTSMRWIRPADALRAHAEGSLHVIFPTRRTLEQLSVHATAAAALHAAGTGAVDLRRIEPTVVMVGGQPMVQHPDGGPPAPV